MQYQNLRVGRGRHPSGGSAQHGMLVPKQDEEDILVGGVPGMRNRGGYTRGGSMWVLGQRGVKRASMWGWGSSHNGRLVTYRETSQINP